MKEINVREVRTLLTRLDEVLESEGELIVTRRGKPIARLLPVRSGRAMPSHADFRRRMPPLAVGSEDYVRKDRDER